MIGIKNFHVKTFAVFKACKTPKRLPDFISESGSRYWYGKNNNGEYVIRQSNHWCQVLRKDPTDKWGNSKGKVVDWYRKKIGKCKWLLLIPKESDEISIQAGKAYIHRFRHK